MEEQRAAGDLVLPGLLATEVTSDRFLGRVNVLKELVTHHAAEEEREMSGDVCASQALLCLGAARRIRCADGGAQKASSDGVAR